MTGGQVGRDRLLPGGLQSFTRGWAWFCTCEAEVCGVSRKPFPHLPLVPRCLLHLLGHHPRKLPLLPSCASYLPRGRATLSAPPQQSGRSCLQVWLSHSLLESLP